MEQQELTDLRDMVRGRLEHTWGAATGAATADIDALWQAMAGDGLFELAGMDALDGLMVAMAELGRAACPLPLGDAFAAARLFGDESPAATAIAAGELRVTFAAGTDGDTASAIETAAAATHVLVVPPAGGTVELRPITGAEPTPGLARPDWSKVTLGPATHTVEADAAAADEALAIIRLALSARAAGAAALMHEFAIEHAKTRIQFGKPIGTFQAVQQRTATCQIDVSASQGIIDQAVMAYTDGNDEWVFGAELATTFVSAAARRVQLGAHHTLAASGYFEEHAGPWLFRRVHADITRAATMHRTAGCVADVLVETNQSLPDLALDEAGEKMREEVRAVLAAHRRPDGTSDDAAIRQAVADKGWLGFGWPEQYGGRSASLTEQVVLHDELAYNRTDAALALGAVMLLGNSILLHGSEEQKARFLPQIRRGEIKFCLGYSEPEVGSDLASVRTKAVRDGDDWVINGQKIWTTNSFVSSHIWLAARTNPDAQPRHAGITVFLIPMDTPGISLQPIHALSGETCSITFLDDLRVPDSMRVGEVDGGWKVITDALAGERVMMGGVATELLRQMDDFLAYVRTDANTIVGPRGSAARHRISDQAATLHALRVLVTQATNATSRGGGARFEAPMAGVLGGELAETFAETILDILGPVGALSDPAGPGGGRFNKNLRLSVMYVVGGGTNDIQRGLISRALGLPR